jgi:glycosyltransferase involved in cell wall biosynthesis
VFAQTYREDHPRPHLRERRKLQELEGREAFVYGRANGLIALTSPLLDDIRSTYRVKTPAIVAPDGVDLRQAQASAHRTGNAVPMLLYLGSLHPWKGVDTLIRAMKQVAHSATLAIIGGSDERIAELTALAKREGVAARVRFEGPVEPAKRFEWIH